MGQLTSDWTDRHVAVALALVVAASAGMATAAEPSPYAVVAGAAVLATVLLALSLDGFGGLVAGLAAAAAVAATKQLTGGWATETFYASLGTTLVLLVLGLCTGAVSARLRERGQALGTTGVAPAAGSLGLIDGDLALVRLDEEIARARRHSRPLALVLLRTDIIDQGMGQAARHAAYRSVARLTETLVRETDVPFALSRAEVGAILPETGDETAWELLGQLVDAVHRASFTVREPDERRSFADCAELQLSLVVLPAAGLDADGLLAAARRALGEQAAGGELATVRTDHGQP